MYVFQSSPLRDFFPPVTETLRLPLTELKCLVGMSSDETLKESFTVLIGFSPLGQVDVLTLLGCSTALTSSPPSHCGYSSTLFFKSVTRDPRVPQSQPPPETLITEDAPVSLVNDFDGIGLIDLESDEDEILSHAVSQIDTPATTGTLQIEEWDTFIPTTPSMIQSQERHLLEELWI